MVINESDLEHIRTVYVYDVKRGNIFAKWHGKF